MTTALADLIPALRREVSPPGADLFPDAADEDFLGYLADGFWEARLDGFLEDYEIDNALFTVSPDLPDMYKYLLVLWAGVRITRTSLSNQRASQKSVAGPVSFEFANSSTMLVAVLKEILAKKDRLIAMLLGQTDVALIDSFSNRNVSYEAYSGYLQEWYLETFGGN